jgi:hypothetical protein
VHLATGNVSALARAVIANAVAKIERHRDEATIPAQPLAQ